MVKLTNKIKHNIKHGEIRKIGNELSKRLESIGLDPKEIFFVGSRELQGIMLQDGSYI